jgi:hemolysin-activating ACP:hemolysin acyltransferase
VLFGPDFAMRHDTNDESDDDDDGSKENIYFLELLSPLGNSAAAVGCQPCLQW